jgi:hypothetical protein
MQRMALCTLQEWGVAAYAVQVPAAHTEKKGTVQGRREERQSRCSKRSRFPGGSDYDFPVK